MKKRDDYINWETYFLALVSLNSKRSKDPSTQVGAVIINEFNQIVSMGYNGLPRNLDDDSYPWDKENKNWLENKYPYIVHAELNAILSSTQKLRDTKLYVSLFPCNECSKSIIQVGIKEVIYSNDKYDGTKENIASKKMLNDAGIVLTKKNAVEVIIK